LHASRSNWSTSFSAALSANTHAIAQKTESETNFVTFI